MERLLLAVLVLECSTTTARGLHRSKIDHTAPIFYQDFTSAALKTPSRVQAAPITSDRTHPLNPHAHVGSSFPSNGSISVSDFGAASSVPDNTKPFQRALDYVALAGGGIVYAPPGSYNFSGSITIPEGVTLRGTSLVLTIALTLPS